MTPVQGNVPIRLLHVHPDPHCRQRVKRFLEKHFEAAVHIAPDPGTGLAILNEDPQVNCVLSSVHFPGMSGTAFHEAVRDKYPYLPFMFFVDAGYDDLEELDPARLPRSLQERYMALGARLRDAVHYATNTRKTRTLLDLLVDSVDVYALYTLDPSGRIQSWNHGGERITGYSAQEAMGQPFWTLFADGEDPDCGNLHCVLDEGSCTSQCWHLRKDKPPFWADVTVSPVFDGGEHVGYAVVTRDMTRERHEAELLRQNQYLQEFAGILAHDLRNPLGVARANLSFVAQDTPGNHVTGAIEALDRMSVLIEDLLKLAATGKLVDDVQPVSLEVMVSEAAASTGLSTDRLAFNGDLVMEADPSRFRQLLENLLRNALVHGGEDVRVKVGCLEHEQGFYLSDDGPGIPVDLRDKVFTMGYSTGGGGTGFGLAIIRQVATAHGWQVKLTGSASGGARFEFYTRPQEHVAPVGLDTVAQVAVTGDQEPASPD